eukprot:9504009-Pyramimonas_sp.AAC.2
MLNTHACDSCMMLVEDDTDADARTHFLLVSLLVRRNESSAAGLPGHPDAALTHNIQLLAHRQQARGGGGGLLAPPATPPAAAQQGSSSLGPLPTSAPYLLISTFA